MTFRLTIDEIRKAVEHEGDGFWEACGKDIAEYLLASMPWTTTPPTEDGFYWARVHSREEGYTHETAVTVVEVAVLEDGALFIDELGEDVPLDAWNVAAWAGPLVPPT